MEVIEIILLDCIVLMVFHRLEFNYPLNYIDLIYLFIYLFIYNLFLFFLISVFNALIN